MVRPVKFEIKQKTEESKLAFSIVGELDMRTVPVLSSALEQSLNDRVTDLTLDLRELAFMDSTGLKLLIELHDRSRDGAWRLKLISPQHEAAALVLRTTGMDTSLPFERDPMT